MGSIAVLVEGARLGVDKAEIPKIKKKVCILTVLGTKCWRVYTFLDP
jgi:hypothetical protein